jgi:hypothetical protein
MTLSPAKLRDQAIALHDANKTNSKYGRELLSDLYSDLRKKEDDYIYSGQSDIDRLNNNRQVIEAENVPKGIKLSHAYGIRGEYNPRFDDILVNSDAEKDIWFSTLIHEAQHRLQSRRYPKKQYSTLNNKLLNQDFTSALRYPYSKIRDDGTEYVVGKPNEEWGMAPAEWDAFARQVGYLAYENNLPITTPDEIVEVASKLPNSQKILHGIQVLGKEYDPRVADDILNNFYKKIRQYKDIGDFEFAGGGYVQGTALVEEENKLLKAAEGYKGTDNIKDQIASEAKADGFDDSEVKILISNVLARLKKTESGKNGGAFGTPHKANDRYNAIRTRLKEVLF